MGLLDSQSEINFKPFLSYRLKVTPFLSYQLIVPYKRCFSQFSSRTMTSMIRSFPKNFRVIPISATGMSLSRDKYFDDLRAMFVGNLYSPGFNDTVK